MFWRSWYLKQILYDHVKYNTNNINGVHISQEILLGYNLDQGYFLACHYQQKKSSSSPFWQHKLKLIILF